MNLRDCRAGAARGEAMAEALAVLAGGGLIVLPTDTVYGIAADPRVGGAVRALLAAKGRSRAKPPPVLIGHVDQLAAFTAPLGPAARALAEALWPGALTLVLRAAPGLRWDLGDRPGTVAVRLPDLDFTRDLLSRAGPLAASSANVTGLMPALTAADAAAQLGESVGVYLDAGSTPGGVPSTVVDVTGPAARVLRVGAIPSEHLADVLGRGANLGLDVPQVASSSPGLDAGDGPADRSARPAGAGSGVVASGGAAAGPIGGAGKAGGA